MTGTTVAERPPDEPADVATEGPESLHREFPSPMPRDSLVAQFAATAARLPWMLAMLAVVVAVLAYPLNLRLGFYEAWLDRAVFAPRAWWSPLALEQVEPFFSFLISPLVLKGVLAMFCALAFVQVTLAGELLRAASRSGAAFGRLREPSPLAPNRTGISVALFVAYAAVAALWSPTPAASREAAAWLIGFGGFAYLLLRTPVSAERRRQFATLLVALGWPVALLSVVQALSGPDAPVWRLFFRFDDPRNVAGSLLGHNTSVGSFLLMTTFPALAMTADRRPALRHFALAYLPIAATAMILTGSRAVWLLAPVLTGLFLWRRMTRRGSALAALLVPLAVLVGLAIVSPSVNSLAFRSAGALRERAAGLAPEALREEARLRLLVVSLPLIGRSPVIGHGLHAFRAIYPEAQGEYFARHPASALGRTDRVSTSAHNEYLQVAVETGIVGLMLALGVLFELWWRGRRRGSQLASDDRRLHAAFGFALAAMALHALVDFPFHLPHLVVPWIVCAAAWAAPGVANRRTAAMDIGVDSVSTTERKKDSHSPLRIVALALAGVLLLAIPAAAAVLTGKVLVSHDFVTASRLLESADAARTGTGNGMAKPIGPTLDQARLRLDRAVTAEPGSAGAWYLLGKSLYTQAEIEDGLKERRRILSDALNATLRALRTEQNHHFYYLLALIERDLAELTPHDRRFYRKNARVHLETALFFSPYFSPALHMLDRSLREEAPRNRSRATELRRRISEHAPHFLYEYYEQPVAEWLAAGRWEDAARGAELLLETDPDHPRYLKLALEARMRRGSPDDRKRVLELAERLRTLEVDPAAWPVHPYQDSPAILYSCIVREDWPGVLEELRRHRTEDARHRAWLGVIEAEARRRTDAPEAVTQFPRPPHVSPREWRELVEETRREADARIFSRMPTDDPATRP